MPKYRGDPDKSILKTIYKKEIKNEVVPLCSVTIKSVIEAQLSPEERLRNLEKQLNEIKELLRYFRGMKSFKETVLQNALRWLNKEGDNL